MSTEVNQAGSQYPGSTTVTGGYSHQGNIINIHQTADRNLLNRCLSDLRITDPRHDKRRIEDTKGGLLVDSYVWVLDNPEFRQWRDHEEQRLLWVKGDPGKGKTMLLCGIIDHLKPQLTEGRLLSYFFCQATDERLRTASAVLRGLIFMLLDQDASLVSHIKKYDTAGKALFEDANAWQALSEIFTNMLQDPKLQGVCLIVDALDECEKDLPQLLDLIVQNSQSTRVKWLFSSRNSPQIEEKLCNVAQRLSLKINATSVSAAVDSYITFKVSQLEQCKGYQEDTTNEVCKYLSSNADGTFLWVALVCRQLEESENWGVTETIQAFPLGLNALYDRMIRQLYASRLAEICKSIIAVLLLAKRPLSVKEVSVFIDKDQKLSDGSTAKMVDCCGSFLTRRRDTVYFTRDLEVHTLMFTKSIETMSQVLKHDIYTLHDPGFRIEDVRRPTPDPLAAVEYSCVYWVSHLMDSGNLLAADDTFASRTVARFLEANFLYWVEALSLLKNLPEGIISFQSLTESFRIAENAQSITEDTRLQPKKGRWKPKGVIQALKAAIDGTRRQVPLPHIAVPKVQALVIDAYRLLQTFRPAIESRPLQAYTSAPVFSPTRSLIRELFAHERPLWIECKTELAEGWSACEATLEGHTSRVRSAAFSGDGRRVVSASDDGTIKLWDAATGKREATLRGHTREVNSAAFSGDGQRVVSASRDKTVRLWNAQTGACLRTYHVGRTSTVAFDPTGTRIHTDAGDIAIDEAVPGEGATHRLKPAPAPLNDVGLSADGAWIQQQSHPVLWLPPEYRPTASAVFATERGTHLALGCSSGRVYLFYLSRS